jgi:hypothetical protein
MVRMIDLPAAKAQIEPFAPRLIDAHEKAVAAWSGCLKLNPEFALPLDATTRANAVHNHLRHQIERSFDTDPLARPNEAMRTFGLLIGSEIFLRFKYVGHGEPHNVATTRQKLLARQEYDDDMALALTGDPALAFPTFLTCGYTLDGEQVGRIEIRRDCEGHQPWSFDIYGGKAVVMPQSLPGQEDTARPARVTKKIAAQGEDAAEAKSAS